MTTGESFPDSEWTFKTFFQSKFAFKNFLIIKKISISLKGLCEIQEFSPLNDLILMWKQSLFMPKQVSRDIYDYESIIIEQGKIRCTSSWMEICPFGTIQR